MSENIYSQKIDTVSKSDYDLLYKEYSKLKNRSKIIEKITDKQLFKQLNKNEKNSRNAKRFNVIIKHSDHQGAKILHEKSELEIKLENELGKEKELVQEIENTQKEIVYMLSSIAESRSRETSEHVKRVAKYSKLLAKYYGLSEDESDLVAQACSMHDIGKVAIPDAILNKPAKLTAEEFQKMKEHSRVGYDMLSYSTMPLMKAAAIVAHEHHEKFDGTGYPRGLQGYAIHLYGRIAIIADVFDALGSDRVYKKAWSDEEIFKYFKEGREMSFDPKLIDIFFEHLDEFIAIRDKNNAI